MPLVLSFPQITLLAFTPSHLCSAPVLGVYTPPGPASFLDQKSCQCKCAPWWPFQKSPSLISLPHCPPSRRQLLSWSSDCHPPLLCSKDTQWLSNAWRTKSHLLSLISQTLQGLGSTCLSSDGLLLIPFLPFTCLCVRHLDLSPKHASTSLTPTLLEMLSPHVYLPG